MNDGESKSEKLKDLLLADMKAGAWGPEAKMPSIRELCRRYDVCKHTASQAVLALKELGLVDVSHGRRSKLSSEASGRVVHVIFIGTAMPFNSEFWGDVYAGMAEAFAKEPSCSVENFAAPSGDTLGDFMKVFNPVTSKGVVLVGIANDEKNRILKEAGVPFVVAAQRMPGKTVHRSEVDISGAMAELVEAFKARGRRRLAFLGPFAHDNGSEKYKALRFREKAEEAGLPVEERNMRDCSFSLEDVCKNACELFRSAQRPDALFVSSDPLCQAVYRAAADCDLRIPDDLSVAGCDNLSVNPYMTPALSGIDIPRKELGRLAVDSLFKLMRGEKAPLVRSVKARFIRRESV